MAENQEQKDIQLEQGTYEILRNRLLERSDYLNQRLAALNEERRKTFGTIARELITTERITTANNCVARDLAPIGTERFIFGYNVHIGLRGSISSTDVFACFDYDPASHTFSENTAGVLRDEQFEADFQNLYKYYRDARFLKFLELGPFLYAAFQIGKNVDDIKVFKWRINGDQLKYENSRSEHEFVLPEQHAFRWEQATRDMHRKGVHPHISINDKVFVETIGGDLTIKVEDNTDTGKGIFSEPVNEVDQTLDDAEVYFAQVGVVTILKIRPYREEQFRYIVFNEKIQEAVRIDALEDSCVLLPEDQGLIYARGYYNQTGEYKSFDHGLQDMAFERRIDAPNGEDYLYVFYNKIKGTYILLSYNIIEQTVQTPIICNGFSLFESGENAVFKTDEEAKKHHAIQLWSTPFHSPNVIIEKENQQNYLYKIGNKEVVKAMAEATELIKISRKEDSYANLYLDIVKRSTDIIDSYHWLDNNEIPDLLEPLGNIRDTAQQAIDEFEKVIRIRKATGEQTEDTLFRASEVIKRAKYARENEIRPYIELLNELRSLKGEVITLKDLRYADLERIEGSEKEVQEVQQQVSDTTVEFLLRDDALEPYEKEVTRIEKALNAVEKVVEINALEKETRGFAHQLELLIDVVSNLKIEDATKTGAILEQITATYAKFNSLISEITKKRKQYQRTEGEAVFKAQLMLIEQTLSSYVELAETPEACNDYLNKLLIQVEELDARFSDFEDFREEIDEKRNNIQQAFESRRLVLLEEINKKTAALQRSGNRIVNSIVSRVEQIENNSDIHAFYAGDVMVEKLRQVIEDLMELGDSVKADELQSKLKRTKEDALRQLRDKKELFANGSDAIMFGKHAFNVNRQNLDLTLIPREDTLYYHLTGTNFFHPAGEELQQYTSLFDQSLVSENSDVYRAEFLAYQLINELRERNAVLSEWLAVPQEELMTVIHEMMRQRPGEGYIKGVHDHDALRITLAMIDLDHRVKSLRFTGLERVLGQLSWHFAFSKELRARYTQEATSFRNARKFFTNPPIDHQITSAATEAIGEFLEGTIDLSQIESVDDSQLAMRIEQALWFANAENTGMEVSKEGASFAESFQQYLKGKRSLGQFETLIQSYKERPIDGFNKTFDWLLAFGEGEDTHLLFEAAFVVFAKSSSREISWEQSKVPTLSEGVKLKGNHPVSSSYSSGMSLATFEQKLHHFMSDQVPAFNALQQLKREKLDDERHALKIDEFKPRVMSSFVRNRLIDESYLPLIGDNLAKQIGTAGDNKRTDLMGLLLLISPPGYGKTTLMEYIASQLGLVFVKINGPSIGHRITSIDPAEATNSASRDELNKLNFALEMGDNVMLYLDDIQHCNPEFLQKFISLCDAQRKIEGVFRGRSKTYDLKGRKVAVVMAGNPYTESGEKFKIPDMLANRADIYNLGDIIGSNSNAFKDSYIENSLTSNSIMNRLATKSLGDVRKMIRLAENGEMTDEFEAQHTPEEIEEYVTTLKKMFRIRDVVLKVNMEYIYSASQADEFRTEPPFKMQGSYRNMNRMVEKVLPFMNDDELENVIMTHYENESQTLTTGTEWNFLKFKSMAFTLTAEEEQRRAGILEVFNRNQRLKGAGGNQLVPVLEQLEHLIS
ncbi:MAG: DNA repair ATPase [Flavobacteriales bacterium]|nr:DNA repair ATPase [Flavobacteriales bacterium]